MTTTNPNPSPRPQSVPLGIEFTPAASCDTISWKNLRTQSRRAKVAAFLLPWTVLVPLSIVFAQDVHGRDFEWRDGLWPVMFVAIGVGTSVVTFGGTSLKITDGEVLWECWIFTMPYFWRSFLREELHELAHDPIEDGWISFDCRAFGGFKTWIGGGLNRTTSEEVYYLLKSCLQRRRWPVAFRDPVAVQPLSLQYSLRSLLFLTTAIAFLLACWVPRGIGGMVLPVFFVMGLGFLYDGIRHRRANNRWVIMLALGIGCFGLAALGVLVWLE